MLDNVTEFTIGANLTDYYFEYDQDEIEEYRHEEDYPYTSPQEVIRILRTVLSILGVFSDLLIIYLTLRCKRMRTKQNLIIANIVFLDALGIIASIEVIRMLRFQISEPSSGMATFFYSCAWSVVDCGFQAGALAFAFVLLSNWLMKRTTRTLKIVAIVYTLLFFSIFGNIFACAFLLLPLSYLLWLGIFVVSLMLVLVKEVNSCYKTCWKKDPLSERTQSRMHVARIYLYNWIVVVFTYLFGYVPYFRPSHYIWEMLHMSRFISGFYLLIYLAFFEKYYRLWFLSLFKCQKASDYDIDATITFAEDQTEENCDDNVNIRFNQTT